MHRHMEDTIVIMNEVTSPHTWCDQFDVFIPQEALMIVYLGTSVSNTVVDQKRYRLAASDAWEAYRRA